MLRESCPNVFYRSLNIATMLYECWLALANADTILRQCCVNAVPTLHFDQDPNIATMLCECWPTLPTLRQCSGNSV